MGTSPATAAVAKTALTGGLVATTTSGRSRAIASRISRRPVSAQTLLGAKASGFTPSSRASGSTIRPATAITWARCAASLAARDSVLISLAVAPAGGLHSTTRQPWWGSTRRRCRQRTLPPPPASSGRCDTTSNVRSGTASGYVFASFGLMKRRRALVLAYLFPPLGGAGVQRTLKFVRYLEPFGWEATVVSTKSRHYPARDPSLLEEIPASAQVVRTA